MVESAINPSVGSTTHKAVTSHEDKMVNMWSHCWSLEKTEWKFNSLISNIFKYIDQHFQSVKSPPISCFQDFYFRFWPKNKAELLRCGDADIKTLVGPFSKVLPEEKTVSMAWLEPFDYTAYPESI